MNKVYLSQVEVYSRRFGKLKEKSALRSDLFFTHEEAYRDGKSKLVDAIRACYESSRYCDGRTDGLTLDDFLSDKKAYYRWTIMEIDLEFLQNYEFPECGNYHLYTSAHVEYEYDLDGELLQRNNWWFFDGVNDSSFGGVCFQNRDGDDLSEAGTRFKIGDFVRLKRPLISGTGDRFETDIVFVVYNTPFRRGGGQLVENTYKISTIGEWGEYLWDLDFHYPFQGIHENELVKHEEKVEEDSPFMFLSRLYKDEIDDAEEICEKLFDGEIVLSSITTWRDIPELKALEGEEER